MDIFTETNYRQIIKDQIRSRPKFGRGLLSQLAKHIGVNATLISQILRGSRNLSEDQAFHVAQFFGLNPKETYYFVLLVQRERAGSFELKNLLEAQIKKIQTEAKSLKGRVSPKAELSLENQAIYYSHWIYSAIHTLVTMNSFRSRHALANKLNLSLDHVNSVVDHLQNMGLIEEKKLELIVRADSTYIPPDSPLVMHHHQNWRQKSVQKMPVSQKEDFFFTAPFSISNADLKKLRQEMVALVSRLYSTVEQTEPEELACINIDLFVLNHR